MRKFYSIVLTACAMLVSASLFAVDVKNLAELQAAIDNTSAGGTVTIRLTDDINIDNTKKPIRVYANYAEEGKTVNLDLNGHVIIASKMRAIELFKGTLNITGKGEINMTATGSYKPRTIYAIGGSTMSLDEAILVSGSYVPTDADWSVLNIGKDVTVTSVKNAVVVMETFVYMPNRYSKTSGLNIANVNEYMKTQESTYATDGIKYEVDPYFTDAEGNAIIDYTTGEYYRWKTTETSAGSGKYDFALSGSSYVVRGNAYGVKVKIEGTVNGKKYGIKINGNIRAGENTKNMPYVHIASTATVSSDASSTSAAAVYSSGYGKFLIEGNVHAATGIYVKGGVVDIKDAVIASDYTGTYSNPTANTYASGINARGSAIIIDSNKFYPGGQQVTISGDTKVKGGSGYAVQEVVTNATDTKVTNVTVKGGTFEAGSAGAIIVDERTVDKQAIAVVGGNIDNLTFVQGLYGTISAVTMNNFFPTGEAENYTTVTIKGDKGQDVIVVVEADKTINDAATVAGATGSVSWTGMSETLNADKTLDLLEMNAGTSTDRQVLTVGDGANSVTLTVGRIILSAYAQIVVKPGSSLIVDGEYGIVAPVVSNLVLETQEGKPAQFLFNPAVTSNRHPNATVEFATKSRREEVGGQTIRVYQRFGIPTHTAVTNIESDAAIQTAIYNFDWTANEGQGDWVVTGVLNNGSAFDFSKLKNPFESYQMLTNTATEGTVYKMKGELFGNDNATMEVHANAWHAFSNSYVANIGIENLVKNGNYANVWVYRRVGTGYAWDAVGKKDFTGWFSTAASKKIEPMQAFYVKGGESPLAMNIDYSDMVWGVRNANLSAPQRRAMNENITLAQLSVSNASYSNLDNLYLIQSDEFGTEYEDGYDAEKMMNDGFNLYVTSDMMLQSVATDNLENTYIGVKTAQAGEYTLAFGNIAGEELALKDLISGEVVNMQEGGEYTFYAAGNNDYRFQIVKRQNVVTDVENVENGMKDGGIYTLTGMYLGNMSVWNTLPAGVYVVNGEKRVK